MLEFRTNKARLKIIARNLGWAATIRDIGERLAAGEQFFWGGQSVRDAQDYYKIAELVARGKIAEARKHFLPLDTPARDPMPMHIHNAFLRDERREYERAARMSRKVQGFAHMSRRKT